MMLKIYTAEQANQTILRRDNAFSFAPNAMTEEQQQMSIAIYGEVFTPDQGVRHILQDIYANGEEALRYWTRLFDGVRVDSLRVSEAEIEAGLSRISAELRQALEKAAERIEQFHRYQPLPNWTTNALGGTLGQRVTPIGRVGIYVPGGTAPLPSSLLMGAIPAKVAGVPQLVVATPPNKDGKIPDVILAAAAIAGITELYAMGGAQAMGALAFGTATIGRVDKIVGPGGLYVTLAKQQLYGIVGIDGLYGPTETVVVADDSADPAWVAADLLAQAEHDVLATAILITPSQKLAQAVLVEIEAQFDDLSRKTILMQSLTQRSGIVLSADLDEACQLASQYAPEHLCLSVADPHLYTDKVANAGGLFIGERSFEVLGDYIAGPSHTMPTSGTARFASPLNVSDFVKITSIIELDDKTSAELSPIAAIIASAEQLDGHANAARFRTKK